MRSLRLTVLTVSVVMFVLSYRAMQLHQRTTGILERHQQAIDEQSDQIAALLGDVDYLHRRLAE